jgi:hypothetical protein
MVAEALVMAILTQMENTMIIKKYPVAVRVPVLLIWQIPAADIRQWLIRKQKAVLITNIVSNSQKMLWEVILLRAGLIQ